MFLRRKASYVSSIMASMLLEKLAHELQLRYIGIQARKHSALSARSRTVIHGITEPLLYLNNIGSSDAESQSCFFTAIAQTPGLLIRLVKRFDCRVLREDFQRNVDDDRQYFKTLDLSCLRCICGVSDQRFLVPAHRILYHGLWDSFLHTLSYT